MSNTAKQQYITIGNINERVGEYKEYLQRPLVEDMTYLISSERVTISCPHTHYATARPVIQEDKPGLLAKYSDILRIAKEKGIRVRYKQHLKKQLVECWPDYEESCRSAQVLYQAIIAQAKIVEARGLHVGTIDDEELARLMKLCSENQQYGYGGHVCSRVYDIACQIEDRLNTVRMQGHDEIVEIFL